MTEASYRELLAKHQGKLVDKWDFYLDAYEDLLGPRRGLTGNVLEIGVQNGGSLELLASYLPAAGRIVGCDINPRCGELRFDDPRIAVVVGDAGAATVAEQLLALAPSFDLVIDDGSHDSVDIIRAVLLYFPLLTEGGAFLIEDLHCSYWRDYHGGLHYEHSAMAFLKALADCTNREHWGFDASPADYLAPYLAAHGIEADLSWLDSLHSVEFRNSMALLRREPAAANRLGTRNVAGSEALVMPEVQDIAGSDCAAPASSSALPPEREPNPALRRLAWLQAQVAALPAGAVDEATLTVMRELAAELAKVRDFQRVQNTELNRLRQENHRLRHRLSEAK